MALAIGGSPAGNGSSTTPARSDHGTLWVDVRDYGAKADGGVTDNAIPFQAAVDDLKSRMAGNGQLKGVVFIPSAPTFYVVYSSVFVDGDGIEIHGEGWGTFVVPNMKQPVFIFGVSRDQTYLLNGVTQHQTVNATNRPDLFGKLDLSAVSGPGSRWGFRTNNNCFAQFQATPLSAGAGASEGLAYSDQYSETNKFTIEFCVEPPDGQRFTPAGRLFACGTGQGTEPSPYTIQVAQPDTIQVTFRTSDIEPGNHNALSYVTYRGFDIPIGAGTGVIRVAIQFDLDNAVCSAFVNGTQVALANLVNMAVNSNIPFTPHSGLTFVMNDHYPFMIGMDGHSGGYGYPTGVDVRVYGLRLSNTLRYQNNGSGHPQVRADAPATAVNDGWAYFGNDANTMCFLRGTDNPATAGRQISVAHGGAVYGGYSSGLIMHSLGSPNFHAQNAIRNISVGGFGGHGQMISLGALFEFTAENVKATGGYHGIGSFPMISSYYIYLKDCHLDGSDAGYFGAVQLVDASNTYFATSGRVTIRSVGCGMRWENTFVAGWAPVCEAIFKARAYPYGGNFYFTNLNVDFEGYPISRAGIYCEAHTYISATSLVLKDVYFGTLSDAAPVIQLKDTQLVGGGVYRAWLSVENVQAYTIDYKSVVDIEGPLWHGEVKGVAMYGPQITHSQKYGPQVNIVIRDTKYVGPPTQYLWYAGAHSLTVGSPADGQYMEWRCAVTGTYGTPTPPVWVGLNPLTISPNGLAGYVLDKVYITAALN